jgi:hypothetical protein
MGYELTGTYPVSDSTMVIRTRELDEFYDELIAEDCLSPEEAWRIFDSLYAEAVSLGAIRDDNILEGLEVSLRVARALNGLTP